MTSPAPFKTATIQFEPTMFEKERNIATLLEMCESAALDGARLIVTPEMGTTGYCWYDRADVAPEVEPIPGPTTTRFHEIARRHDCYIVVGLPEIDEVTGLYYNSAALIGPGGIVGKHRKSHPYIAEPKWAASGDEAHAVFDTPIGRIAIVICMDLHFFETVRLETLQGADVICHISNWLAERTPAPYWITRAWENGCYVVESNRWGLERTVQFSGGSCIIGPDGVIEASVDSGNAIVTGLIDPARARKREVLGEPVFEMRRPELYKTLMTNSFTWNPLEYHRLYGYQPLPEGTASTLAVAQFTPADDPARNLAIIESHAADAAARGASLLVLPELCLTKTPEPITGDTVDGFTRIAMRHRLHMVAGFAERDGELAYNSVVLSGPEGRVGSYRKIHLSLADRTWATAGDRWAWFDLPFGRVGLLTGTDALLPEAARVLGLEGCDIIACPAALPQGFTGAHEGTAIPHNFPIPKGADPFHWHAFRTRSGENNLHFAFANAGDQGLSGIFGADTFAFPRQESAILNAPGMATLDIDLGNLGGPYPTNVTRRKDLITMRLPHHYTPLVIEGSQLSAE
ncbi:amidohydrolase [Salipiger pallidus]|uniref:Amidohydrolase n=1 Tax=Salipiger pallidus TaxID=1775170 RepID=A0A8J3EIF1_9RHOB|nr:nitrilase-related carbon-nitrogen hydrolase [Salipiger pallidus]GGG85447.1 amidohydrolase [Salipiger pallidus]